MKYKLLNHASYVSGEYEVHTIRSEDMAAIGRWRNEQIDVLRQTRTLSEEELLLSPEQAYRIWRFDKS